MTEPVEQQMKNHESYKSRLLDDLRIHENLLKGWSQEAQPDEGIVYLYQQRDKISIELIKIKLAICEHEFKIYL